MLANNIRMLPRWIINKLEPIVVYQMLLDCGYDSKTVTITSYHWEHSLSRTKKRKPNACALGFSYKLIKYWFSSWR
jgi:hypothetical protein